MLFLGLVLAVFVGGCASSRVCGDWFAVGRAARSSLALYISQVFFLSVCWCVVVLVSVELTWCVGARGAQKSRYSISYLLFCFTPGSHALKASSCSICVDFDNRTCKTWMRIHEPSHPVFGRMPGFRSVKGKVKESWVRLYERRALQVVHEERG